MNHHENSPGGPPAPRADDEAARLARDDIYRLVALLWQLDRLHRPVLLQAPGDFRIAADPPALLPPTGVPGMSADQAPQVWAPEPARRPQRPLPPVTVAWVEPAAVTAERQVAVPTPQPPAPQDPVRQPPRPWQPAPTATATPPAAPEQPAAQQAEPAGAPSRANPTVVPRGPASPPDTQPTQPAGRTRPGGEGPGDSRDFAPASAEPDQPDSPPSRPPARPPTESTLFRPESAAPDPAAELAVAPAPAPGSPDLAAVAGVPAPGVPPGPRVPRPTAAGPPAVAAPPAVEARGYSQLAPQELGPTGPVAAAPALRPHMADSAVTTGPQPGPDPTVIVPSGHFSPSPVPAPADDPRPELDEADFDEDWDEDPLPDPGRYRQAIVMRRGQQAGALTRTEAARLEEELRRRFRDRSPGGAP